MEQACRRNYFLIVILPTGKGHHSQNVEGEVRRSIFVTLKDEQTV